YRYAATHQLFERVDRRARLFGGGRQHGEETIERAVDGHPQQFLLAADVVVDRRFRDPESGCQLVDAGSLVAALVEQADRYSQDRLEVVSGPSPPSAAGLRRGVHPALTVSARRCSDSRSPPNA